MECYKGENIMDFAFIPAIISALLYIFDFTSMSAAVGIVSGIIAVIMGETLIHSFAQIILTLILRYTVLSNFTNYYGFGYASIISIAIISVCYILFLIYYSIFKQHK
ncbi:hypothetical protein VEIDISOL_00042 [Veillonella dispar ATCC 17748]|uniref:Uncharacterized protein n=2 Tax=Veillonella dispar TaxID=39778 RepID=C4FMI4_9FIRM|nr:hypothetical protein VEIDISOL_00042 [Veillonella dispar ATCC 17748]